MARLHISKLQDALFGRRRRLACLESGSHDGDVSGALSAVPKVQCWCSGELTARKAYITFLRLQKGY